MATQATTATSSSTEGRDARRTASIRSPRATGTASSPSQLHSNAKPRPHSRRNSWPAPGNSAPAHRWAGLVGTRGRDAPRSGAASRTDGARSTNSGGTEAMAYSVRIRGSTIA